MAEPFADEKAETSYWETQFKTCMALRKTYEEQWYMNLAFYFSKQWVIPQRTASGGFRLFDPTTPRNRVRLTANRIKPIIRDEHTKLIKEEPQFFVQPNTTDMKDVAAARAGEAVADSCIHNRKFNRNRRIATYWSLITGTGFIKTTCSGTDKDIIYEPPTTFHMYFPDLDNPELQTQPYIIQARGLTTDDVEERFGVKIAPDMQIAGASMEQKFLNAIGIKNREGESKKSLVFVKEIWIKPCSRYPDGGLLIYGGNQLIYRFSPDGPQVDENNIPVGRGADHFAYEHGEFPFAKIDHTATGRFYGESIITDCIPLQKEYNRWRSQLLEYKNRMAKPQMTYVKGSIDVTKVTSEPGLYIPVMPGFEPPQPVKLQDIPSYAVQEGDRIKSDMDEIAGRTEVSRGTVPTGVEAASAIAYLKEENDSKIYNTIASIEEAVEDVGKQTLQLVQQFWTEQKIISVVSKNNIFEARIFKITGLDGNTDFRVEAGSMAPKSMAAKQAFIVDLMKEGILPPEKGLRYLQMNETNRLYEELQVDSRHAQRENFAMANGQPAKVNPWDNTPVHIYEHELYMKGQEFEMLDPEVQNAFIMHLTEQKGQLINAIGTGGPGNSNPTIPAPVATNGQYAPTG